MKIAFIGCGNMAQSLIGGMIANGLAADSIVVADPFEAATSAAAEKWGVSVADNNTAALKHADTAVLAVKPQKMKAVLSDVNDDLDSQLLISIAAGIRIQDMMNWAGADNNSIAVVRCMPNTPALLQCGATGLFADPRVTSAPVSYTHLTLPTIYSV